MLTPSQFGALQTPPIGAEAVRAAIRAKRITPRPKSARLPNGKHAWLIDPAATIAPPRKPGPKGPRKASK
jgi:hypothetical protein